MDVGAGEGTVVELDKDDESAKLADVKLGVLAGESKGLAAIDFITPRMAEPVAVSSGLRFFWTVWR